MRNSSASLVLCGILANIGKLVFVGVSASVDLRAKELQDVKLKTRTENSINLPMVFICLFLRLCFDFMSQRPTVCVTRAGAGGGTPSDWKNAEALKKAWNRARIPSVGCTLCWATVLFNFVF